MTVDEILKYLKEGTTGSDVTKTDVFLDSLMKEAARTIETLLRKNSDLEWVVEYDRNDNDYYKRTQWI